MNNIIKASAISTLLMTNLIAIENHLELSYVDTSGNSDTTTFAAKLDSKANLSESSVLKAKVNAIYSEDSGETSANKYNVELDYDYLINEKWYAYMGINYIQDELSDYDYRINVGPGIGYKFINTDKQLLDLQGGLDYAYDKYENGTSDDYVAARTEANYKYSFSENVEFKQMLNYLVSLEDEDKYFANSDSGIRVKVAENLALGVSYRVEYTNQTNEEHTDRKFMTSLIVDF